MKAIYVSAADIAIQEAKSAASSVDHAIDLLGTVNAAIGSFKQASLFPGSRDELRCVIRGLKRKQETLDSLVSVLSKGTQKIEDADDSFKGFLSQTSWAKLNRGLDTSSEASLIGQSLGVSAPLFALFSSSIISNQVASINTSADKLTPSSLLNSAETKPSTVAISNGDRAEDVANNMKSAVIDNWRKGHGREGKKEEHERYYYSSTDSGTVSILGTDFSYRKYTDYTGGKISTTEGDRFYYVDSSFGKECTHIDFESNDGSGFSGDITMNGITAYGTGEFDLAKGNAYIKAGADYSMYSLTLKEQGDMGSVSLTGEIGAGLHLDAGIHDGKITIDVGVALGLGVGFSIELDYKSIWDATCNAFGF